MYKKTIWHDQQVERPKTYEFVQNSDGSYKCLDSFGEVVNLGTPLNAANLNKIEEGIASCAIRKFSNSETYKKGEWIIGSDEGKTGFYESLSNENLNNPLDDSLNWKKIDFEDTLANIYLSNLNSEAKALIGRCSAIGKRNAGTYVLNTVYRAQTTMWAKVTVTNAHDVSSNDRYIDIGPTDSLGIKCGGFYSAGSGGAGNWEVPFLIPKGWYFKFSNERYSPSTGVSFYDVIGEGE